MGHGLTAFWLMISGLFCICACRIGTAAGKHHEFPIAVWLQSPHNAPKYKAIGINLYVGLWKGPTAKQISELKRHRMPVICAQNKYALSQLDEKLIVAWMHGDEPDNAQSLGAGKGYGPPVPPSRIAADYRAIKARDPSRPVLLNLGQGVAWDGWHGRGVRTNHPEDYPHYVKGCDIASFDIYPAVHSKPAIAGKLWYVPYGVTRLRGWTKDKKPVWSCIECTRISNINTKPTPAQVKAEVWMAIIHGAKGLIYFCHQFKPRFIEAGLLADNEMARAVGAVNKQINDLAPVINSPDIKTSAKASVTVTVEPSNVPPDLAGKLGKTPVAIMVKQYKGATYLFAVRMTDQPCKATFAVKGIKNGVQAKVLGEDGRTIAIKNGRFTDNFKPWEVHIYRL